MYVIILAIVLQEQESASLFSMFRELKIDQCKNELKKQAIGYNELINNLGTKKIGSKITNQ